MAILQKKTIVNGNTVWVDFPTPSSVQFTKSDLDSDATGRNQKGLMFRDVIASKVKLEVEWGILTGAQVSTIYSLVNEPFITIKYPDASTGQMEEMVCYVGDRTAPAYTLYNGAWVWNGLSINFIQR